MDLFAGTSVTDLERAVEWYTRFLGEEPSFRPNDSEAVWQLAEHRFLYVEVRPEHAGHGLVTVFLADLDGVAAEVSQRGIEPVSRETYGNGVRKFTYRDPDENEIGYGGAPLD